LAKKTITIKSIWDGHSPSQYYGKEGSYNSSLAIDPDFPISSSDVKASGFLVPTAYSDFTGSNLTDNAIAIINTPKNTNTYVVTRNGRLISYDSSLANETLIGTITSNTSNGAFYYNNYIYIIGTTDVSRYGPLDNSPSLTNTFWTSTLSLTALTNTTYPVIRGDSFPNHWGFVHGDGSAYFCDFINGQGMLHRINTKKVTSEGDTNGTTVPSAYNVLDLPFGWYPMTACSYGTDIAILAVQTIDTTIDQGKAALFLWDPTNVDSFYAGPIYLPDPLATAILNDNGILKVFSGNASSGVRISKYIGGQSFQEIVYHEEGTPPFPGAVDSRGSRLVWGGWTTYPSTSACVWAYGSKNDSLPKGIHNIIKTSSSGATPNVTACKFVQQASNKTPQMVVGWRDDSDNGVDKYSTSATLTSVFRVMLNVGQQFDLLKMRVPLAGAVGANTSITPKFYLDDASSNKTLTVINNSNYPSKRKVVYKTPELVGVTGETNLMLEFTWGSTSPTPIALPITLDLNIHDDD